MGVAEVEPPRLVDLGYRYLATATGRPFDLDRVACDRGGIEIALGGVGHNGLAAGLPDFAERH